MKQTAILVIMAHLGSWIPAGHATVRLTDRVCTRMGSGDDMEANASTFLKEMKETVFILEACAPSVSSHDTRNSNGARNLVLIDELGRG
jgi:DNA mismatch repair ATPase MutS